METTSQQQVVFVKQQKSMVLALILTFFLGPLGLLYASVKGGIVMFFMTGLVALFTLGIGLLITWPLCMVWAAVAVNTNNNYKSN